MPRSIITLPKLHPGQVAANALVARRKAVRCGRRWGKSEYGIHKACHYASKGWPVGWFTPDMKTRDEVYDGIVDTLEPMLKRSSSVKGLIKTLVGGGIDFWTLDNKRAGRSRKYKLVIIDEAAFTKDTEMMQIWEQSIEPTLLDYQGDALIMSNTNGVSKENFFWRICNEPEHGFIEYHAPTIQNPFMPAEEIEALRLRKHPLVFKQEYEAEFVDFSGVQFFDREKMLVYGAGVPYPTKCDSVFAVIDTASKTGMQHDATGVTYFARNRYLDHPLVVLDWDIVQIQADLLSNWMPGVYARLEMLARQCGAREGSLGSFIEDQNSGVMLNQTAVRMGWGNRPISGELTSRGKDGRAIACSEYVYQGMVKISDFAHNKTAVHKERSMNHWEEQVFGFRIGDPDAAKRADDLLDTCTYGILLALGDQQGFT